MPPVGSYNLIDEHTRGDSPVSYPAINSGDDWLIKIGSRWRFAIPAKLRHPQFEIMAFEAEMPELKRVLHRRSGWVYVSVSKIEERTQKPLISVYAGSHGSQFYYHSPFRRGRGFPSGCIQEIEVKDELEREINNQMLQYKLIVKETRREKLIGDIGIFKKIGQYKNEFDLKPLIIVDSIGKNSKDMLYTERKNTFERFNVLSNYNISLYYAFPMCYCEPDKEHTIRSFGYKIYPTCRNFWYLAINERSLKDFFINKEGKEKKWQVKFKKMTEDVLTVREVIEGVGAGA